MKKKIMMISSTWNTSFIGKILNGVMRRLENENADIYVFNAYDEALESEYHLMERAIYSLPDPTQFDGVLLAVNSVGNQGAVHELAKFYSDLGKKVLSMELKLGSIPTIGTDNYQAEYDLITHLIEVHNCQVFNYVGGPADHLENLERYQAFCDCLKAHGILQDKERELHLSFRDVDGIEAYEYFKERNLHLPDAVVCANDNMALGYATAAAEDGYIPPNDFRLVGFDNVEEAKNYFPSITSVDRCWEQLGYDSVKQLLDMIDGVEKDEPYFSGQKLMIHESCGCHSEERNFHKDYIQSYKDRLAEENMNVAIRKSRKLLCRSLDLEDFQKNLCTCQEMLGIEKMAVCINQSMFFGDVKEKMDYDDVFEVFLDEKQYTQQKKDGLLPEDWKKDRNIYFFAPLHLGKINFGYCVLTYNGDWQNKFDHRTFMESICLGLESIRQQSSLGRMNSRLEDLYVRDAMTGMYNRFGYESFAKAFFEKNQGNVFVAYMDLDNLKLYNDRFGHEIGDSAILGVTEGIRYAFGKDSVYVRMGGDEFLVVGRYEGRAALAKCKSDLAVFLADYSEKKQLPFSLSVSVGYICNDSEMNSLDEMIWLADHNMYQEKQKKKHKKNENDGAGSKMFTPELATIIEKIPDVNYNVDEVFITLRRYVPDLTSQYGVIFMGASIVSFNMGEPSKERRQDIVLYDVRAGKPANEYVLRFETGKGGFVSIVTGIPKDAEWTADMKRDIFILSKTIFLLVGRTTALQTLSMITYMDQMTGIANGRRLNQIMMKKMEEGILHYYTNNFVNIRNMKLFNGRYGDKIGDQMIIAFANGLRNIVGENGCAARLGGDNFLVFIETAREEEFLEYMQNLSIDLKDHNGEVIKVKVGTRIGYYNIQPGDNFSDAMSNSSIAFHYAQRENRRDIVAYEEDMKKHVLRRKELEENAPEAIGKQEFVVFYQPKADISESGKFRLNGGEALVRWKKDGNMILPYEFIPVLENSGVVTKVDFYVFEQVCKDIAEWQAKGIEPVRISSNFSRRHLKDEDFVDKIEAIIRKYDIDPQYLEVEITESYDLDDMEVLRQFEQKMHKLGIHLSVDDFGSGFSSIKMIKNIVSDTIKLDKSIIDGIGENRGDEVIVQHMIQMIQSLGKDVIAEGVENEVQANFLRENACLNIQGYLFGKPMEKKDFEVLLRNR